MRYPYLAVCFAVLVLAAVAARDDPEVEKRGRAVPPAPASPADVPRVSLEAQKVGQNAPTPPASPLDAPITDLEAMKRGLRPFAGPASPADAPSVDLEELKRLGQGAAPKLGSSSVEKETERVSQLAIEAIPLTSGGSGPKILPFPDEHGQPLPISGSL